ncbi:hypothetical protein JCM14076_16590 [Methylosoma difficile]
MYTACPNCRASQTITVEQLRLNRAIAYCPYCAIRFDALELLSETTATDENTELPWEHPPVSKPPQALWQIGALLSGLLLISQFLYFEGYGLTQHPKFRPILLSACKKLACKLPAYQNINELVVLAGSLTPAGEQHYQLNTVISNRAAFEQANPKIILTLLDYTGQAFSYRQFTPQDYFPGIHQKPIAPDTSLTIHLDIAATQAPIGGYNLELTY